MVANTQSGIDAATEPAGMPQLDFVTFPNQIFWLAIALVSIYLILSRVALPRIESILTDRQSRISTDIAEAEKLKGLAEKAEQEYQDALARTKAEAQAIASDMRAAIESKMSFALEEAEEEIADRMSESAQQIDDIRADAKASTRDVATDVAVQLITTLLGSADSQKIATAVEARMRS